MTAPAQRRLAIAGALAAVAVFLGANAHLITVAVNSHPACAPVAAERAPATPSC